MPTALAFRSIANASSRELARRSRGWERMLERTDAAALLLVAEPKPDDDDDGDDDDMLVLGELQRAAEVAAVGENAQKAWRGSGGAAVRVGPGAIWMQLALRHVDALVPCTPDKLVNRYVRPLLRALTRTTSVPASYFGRDWISAKHQPVALVAFAHDSSTKQAFFEAIIGVKRPVFDRDKPRASFLGKTPATLEEIAGRTIDASKVIEAILAAYRDLAATSTSLQNVILDDDDDDHGDPAASSDPPWTATREEAIGTIGAGRDATGRMRIGGELMASRDAIARLEDAVAKLPPDATPDDVGRVVDEALTSRGAITFGVRSLASIRDVIVEALAEGEADPQKCE